MIKRSSEKSAQHEKARQNVVDQKTSSIVGPLEIASDSLKISSLEARQKFTALYKNKIEVVISLSASFSIGRKPSFEFARNLEIRLCGKIPDTLGSQINENWQERRCKSCRQISKCVMKKFVIMVNGCSSFYDLVNADN